MRGLWRDLVDLVAPPVCARCGCVLPASDPRRSLCAPCERALPAWPGARCALCAEGVAPARGRSCAGCVTASAPLAGVVAALRYTGEVEEWVQRFKYPRPGLAGLDAAPQALLADALARAIRAAALPAPDLVTAVPQSPRRLRERGFNPAERLARAAARAAGAPCDPALLVRPRNGPSQTGLDRAARRRNVAGTFAVRSHAVIPARVWLVDDVVTTGATLLEAARALRRRGALEIVGACVARVPFGR
jgi:ComF family protein